MLKKHLMCGLSLVALATVATACSDDIASGSGKDVNVKTEEVGPGAYISVDFTMPSGSGTRSVTPAEGTAGMDTEVGSDIENTVQQVAILLTDTDNNLIAYCTASDGQEIEQPAADTYRAYTLMPKTRVDKFYSNETGQILPEYASGIYVYVVCNYPKSFYETLTDPNAGSKDWIDAYGEVTETNVNNTLAGWQTTGDIPWTEKNFVMSSAEVALRQIPYDVNMWDQCLDHTNAFKLSANNTMTYAGTTYTYPNGTGVTSTSGVSTGGAIKVQRAAARFDYKDGSSNTDQSRYNVIYMTEANGGKTPYVDVILEKMSLVNMGRHYYIFKRVSANGTKEGINLCGDEIGGTTPNYVVDWDCDWKLNAKKDWKSTYAQSNALGEPDPNTIEYHFNFPLFTDGNFGFPDAAERSIKWYTNKVADVLKNNEDNADYKETGYHVWRYASENAIPGPEDTQVNGLSTGIVFKARMTSAIPTNGLHASEFKHYEDSLHNALKGDYFLNEKDEKDLWKQKKILYLMNGMLYYTWEHVRAEALVSAIGKMPETESVESEPDENGVYLVTWKTPSQIARSNADYLAVFGEKGFGKFTLTLTVDNKIYSGPITDSMGEMDEKSPNFIACKWNGRDPYTNEVDGTYRPASSPYEKTFKEAATDNGITIYQPSFDADLATPSLKNGWGYYCYYYYWNRHNDNNKPGTMGAMEFAVVRNNVYKLSVTDISRLGHPRLIENDPNPPEPGTDDETDNIYLSVQCQVLPWTVRLNNIVF